MPASQPTTSQRKRAPQQRAENTRAEILRAAVELFTSLGFEGVALRTIEAHAGVQRGAIAYHFDSKDELWRRAIDRVFERFAEFLDPLESTLRALDPEARFRMAIAAFVRFNAETPELNRLMVQEGKQPSWRLEYIVDTHMRRRIDWLNEILDEPIDPHTYYIVIGAGAMVFSVEYECQRAFGVDPKTDEFIRVHAARIADMTLLARKHTLDQGVTHE